MKFNSERNQLLTDNEKNSFGLSEEEREQLTEKEICDDCSGQGWTTTNTDDEQGEYSFEEKCTRCNGTGLEP